MNLFYVLQTSCDIEEPMKIIMRKNTLRTCKYNGTMKRNVNKIQLLNI